jgi:hypothetical protein
LTSPLNAGKPDESCQTFFQKVISSCYSKTYWPNYGSRKMKITKIIAILSHQNIQEKAGLLSFALTLLSKHAILISEILHPLWYINTCGMTNKK